MKMFEQVYCVIKTSAYQQYQKNSSQYYSALREDRRQHIEQGHQQQQKFIQQLHQKILEHGLEVHFVTDSQLSSIQPTRKDLVLSCGGDGTFLSCAKHYKDSVLLGLNSNFQPNNDSGSHGALAKVNQHNLDHCFEQLTQGNYQLQPWPRLSAKINNHPIKRYAVNEIYMGSANAFFTSSFSLTHQGQLENFRCSGFIACTQVGSQAWFTNAGGESFSLANMFAFWVLLPNKHKQYHFKNGLLKTEQQLVACSNRENQILSLDSKEDVINLKLGDQVSIFLATENPVRVLQCDSKG